MGFQLSKEQYLKLIECDIDYLKDSMEDCLERSHIISVLQSSVDHYYPEILEAQQFIKFHPDGETYNIGDYVHPVSSKKGLVIMEKRTIDPDALTHYVVTHDDPDENGCIMAIVYKNKQLCKCGRPLPDKSFFSPDRCCKCGAPLW
jgi:hypothetical protein